jgi:hypothetical protein
MASEMSFGARLLRAQNLHSYITNFVGFTPPRTQESATAFGDLLAIVSDANIAMSNAKQNYNTATTQRFDAFRNNANSVFKLLPIIRGAVEAQYGKSSLEFKQIDGAIKIIRNNKIVRIAATETTEASTISLSEQSYGSSTQYFTNLVNNLTQLTGYNPSNATIKIPALQALLTHINSLNMQVATSYQAMSSSRNARNIAYTDLKDRASRIKAYTKGNYGTTSPEYKLVKGLSI